MTVPVFQKLVGRHLKSVFGPSTEIYKYGEDSGLHTCDVIAGYDVPVRGVKSYGSIGLSNYFQRVGDRQVRVEVVAACDANTPCIDNIVSSCVFEYLKNGQNIAYGESIRGMVSQYGISQTLEHVAFVAPFLWEGLHSVAIEDQNVYCLLALPVSEAEIRFLDANGVDSLEKEFEAVQIDVFDINRPCVFGQRGRG